MNIPKHSNRDNVSMNVSMLSETRWMEKNEWTQEDFFWMGQPLQQSTLLAEIYFISFWRQNK